MMMAQKFLPSRNSSDPADLDPRTPALETAAVDNINSAGEMSATMANRPLKPQVPPQKTHLDEVYRLTKELDEIREEREQAENMIDMMGQDLSIAQEEVWKKGDELGRKEEELLKCEKELQNWRQKAQILSIEVQEQKRLAVEIEQSTKTQEVAVASNIDDQSRMKEELLRLRDQVASLTASLATKEIEKKGGLQSEKELMRLREQIEQLTASHTETESRMKVGESQAMKDVIDLRQQITHLEFNLHEKEVELSSARISWRAGAEAKVRGNDERAGIQWQKRGEKAKASLPELTKRMHVDINQEHLLQRIHSLEAEVQDQRKSCDWFRRNSERLSKEIKETRASRKVLERSEYAAKGQLVDLQSQVTALQRRARGEQMPGTY